MLIVDLIQYVYKFIRTQLRVSDKVKIIINDDPAMTIKVPIGGRLLKTLADNKIYIPSACGGNAICGECRVIVKSGGGEVHDSEKMPLDEDAIKNGYRLCCQLEVKEDLSIVIPIEVLKVRKWMCTVRSNKCVASFIKELVLELPKDEHIDFRAGGYIQIESPSHTVFYKDFNIDLKYKEDWDKLDLWKISSTVNEPVARAYSMANYPLERDIVMLNVRLATTPYDQPKLPTGQMSSYIFSLKPGDKVRISGPYGKFFAKETDNEMIFVGGGAGMAPMRSHIYDQLKRIKTNRKISYWYGARSLKELFYVEEFDALQKEHPNFRWNVALSAPLPEDRWSGAVGFVHQFLFDCYLKNHPAPMDCEYYLCGPPMMTNAVVKMLSGLGVKSENIFFDDFGG
ncbi:MAG: NADH:ubiquinone reductase (Na(+)-transporting) subunit F [Nitrospirae bacterium]|nr:NADH:ubiquinone reductase (Na(+)-transporting) subunit F [Nitrospirota bacterium]